MASTKTKSEEYTDQDARFGFECLRNMKDGKVNLAGVGTALGYKNVQSVGNRFRQLRSKFGWSGLECTTSASPAKKKAASKDNNSSGEDDDEEEAAAATASPAPAKRGAGKAGRKPRKGARVSNGKPIPATGPVAKDGENPDEEESEAREEDFAVEIKNGTHANDEEMA